MQCIENHSASRYVAVKPYKWRATVQRIVRGQIKNTCTGRETCVPSNVFHYMACCLRLSFIGAQKALANGSVYCATRKHLPSLHRVGLCEALTGQTDDGSHQVQLSVTTVLADPKLCPIVILGSH